MVIMYINIVELGSPMLYIMFQGHRAACYCIEDFKGIHHIHVWV